MCFPLHLLSIRCVTLSLMARLSFQTSLALWLTVGKAWIMFARTGTDRPSCAVDLFISRTYLNEPFSVPRGAQDEMSVWIGRRETKKRGKKSKSQESVLHMQKKKKIPGVVMWAGLKQLEVTSLQANLTGWREVTKGRLKSRIRLDWNPKKL